ncbi:MAG: hypothetical protein QNL91_02110 [Candidatus Krumholzibacteria bacterium]|nr:hypothetical protein [Candidatus Krumholzibacteria bacterium]
MKKMVYVIALAAIALTSVSAFAQIDPAYQNDIGIYLDESGDTAWACLPLNTPTDAYLVLSRLTATEVLGWEARISFTNMTVLAFADRGQAIDIGTRPDEHVVGFAAPLPTVDGVVVVADLQIMVINNDPAYAFADEIYFSLLENGLPAYIDGASAGYSLHPVFGGVDDPIFIINEDCGPVAVEDASFGSVKSLFR